MPACARCLLAFALATAGCIPFPRGKKPDAASQPPPSADGAPVEAAATDTALSTATASQPVTMTATGTATATDISPPQVFEAHWQAAAADDERRIAAFEGLSGPEVTALFEGPLAAQASAFYQLRVPREDGYAAAQQHFTLDTSDDTVRMVCFRRRVFKGGAALDEPGTCRIMILGRPDGASPANLVQTALIGDYRRVTAQMTVAQDDERLAAMFGKTPFASEAVVPLEAEGVDKQVLRIFCPVAERSCRIQLQVPR